MERRDNLGNVSGDNAYYFAMVALRASPVPVTAACSLVTAACSCHSSLFPRHCRLAAVSFNHASVSTSGFLSFESRLISMDFVSVSKTLTRERLTGVTL